MGDRVDPYMATINVTSENFESTLDAGGITFVDWWAQWCGPCRNFAPIFEKASEQNSDITFAKIDTEDQQQLSAAVGITSLPTLMAFRDGILVYQQPGAIGAAALDGLITAVRELDMEEVRQKVAEQQVGGPQ